MHLHFGSQASKEIYQKKKKNIFKEPSGTSSINVGFFKLLTKKLVYIYDIRNREGYILRCVIAVLSGIGERLGGTSVSL